MERSHREELRLESCRFANRDSLAATRLDLFAAWMLRALERSAAAACLFAWRDASKMLSLQQRATAEVAFASSSLQTEQRRYDRAWALQLERLGAALAFEALRRVIAMHLFAWSRAALRSSAQREADALRRRGADDASTLMARHLGELRARAAAEWRRLEAAAFSLGGARRRSRFLRIFGAWSATARVASTAHAADQALRDARPTARPDAACPVGAGRRLASALESAQRRRLAWGIVALARARPQGRARPLLASPPPRLALPAPVPAAPAAGVGGTLDVLARARRVLGSAGAAPVPQLEHAGASSVGGMAQDIPVITRGENQHWQSSSGVFARPSPAQA